MSPAAEFDRRHVWHPFTPLREWCEGEPLVIVEGEGAELYDAAGRTYLDGNASIWTNLHGHRCGEIDAAIREQLARIGHASFLGLANEPAAFYARELLQAFTASEEPQGWRVFYSDDGSTAMEAGLKMIHQARAQRGEPERRRYLSLAKGYHGDTVGAMSLGHSETFHRRFAELLFPTTELPPPTCYRCPWNRARPVRGVEARMARECDWECATTVERALDAAGSEASALVVEPLVQGAAGMAMHAHGWLARVATMCRERGVWLLLDEVLTGFGRTGACFAAHKEGVSPEVIALGKGITGGYLPLAATLASGTIVEAFMGGVEHTFFHGHSYSGNALGCAAARASLKLLQTRMVDGTLAARAHALHAVVQRFWEHPCVGDVRCDGMIAAIELVENFNSRAPLPASRRTGFHVCMAARRHGLLTRNIGDVLILLPPYCITDAQLARAAEALWHGLCEVLPL